MQINLIAPPLYVVTTTSLDKDKGIALLTKAIENVKEVITAKKGNQTNLPLQRLSAHPVLACTVPPHALGG